MAPCNATTSTPPKLVVTLPPNHGTLQWHPTKAPKQWHHVHMHPAMAPSNGTTVHSTIAHYNGTLQWHPAMAPRPLNHSTVQWHPAMSPSNGTTSTQPWHTTMAPYEWHPAMAPRPLHPAMAFWCHVQCAKVVRRPPPLLEVRTPIAIAIWGKKTNRILRVIDRGATFFLVAEHQKQLRFVKSWSLLLLWDISATRRVSPGRKLGGDQVTSSDFSELTTCRPCCTPSLPHPDVLVKNRWWIWLRG